MYVFITAYDFQRIGLVIYEYRESDFVLETKIFDTS